MKYLIEKQPVVLFRTDDHDKAEQSLTAFWNGFSHYHSTHEVCSLGEPMHHLIPVTVYGDEGRGKRRPQSTAFSLESLIGIKGNSSVCSECTTIMSWDAPYGEDDGQQHPFLEPKSSLDFWLVN